ncbi:hypothetical protein UlMin_032195 [Ulmus minor]
MGCISFCSSSLLSIIFIFLCLLNNVAGDDSVIGTQREALEIIIGGGGGSSPPPEPIPHSNPLERLQLAQRVILKFKQQIDVDCGGDPKGITKTWIENGDVCKYKGFTCDTLPGKGGKRAVSGVKFNGYRFVGKNNKQLNLQGFLDQLPDLAFFHANSNNFTSTVPPNIGTDRIKYFYELDLSNNKLQGEFPKEVLKATNLTFLDLRFNCFHGTIPSDLFKLDVQVIFINNNNFEQQLPYNLGETPALYLTFANNKFSGLIPSTIGNASKLIEVLFLNNSLSGCLPYEIGYLKNATLFDASLNQLTGPIPYSFACLEKMELLNFASNQLYGEVPELVCKLPKLEKLTLSNNYITHVGPACRKLIDRKVLNVKNNCILDIPNQKSKAECAHFFSTPKHCPNEKLMSYVPCKKQRYFHGKEYSKDKREAPAPAPVTYGALVPNGL